MSIYIWLYRGKTKILYLKPLHLTRANLYDVEFKITDENSHKFLPSLLFLVLKKTFMHTREEESIDVEITGPFFISFQTLIQFLYTGDESVITGQLNHWWYFDFYIQMYPPLMICWYFYLDVSSNHDLFDLYFFMYSLIDDLFDLNVQIYPLLMIFLICMVRCILYWWSYWSLCSDVSSIDDLIDLYVQIYPLLMILSICMFKCILYWWSLSFFFVSSTGDLIDLYVQIYPLMMILLIFMFRCILY